MYRLQVGLNDGKQPPKGDRGEAEGIFFAEKHDGQFATDDNNAYDFARRRPTLGAGRVIDSIHILRGPPSPTVNSQPPRPTASRTPWRTQAARSDRPIAAQGTPTTSLTEPSEDRHR